MEATTPHQKGRNVMEYVRILLNRRWTILAVFLIVLGIGAFNTFTEPPVYRATAQLLIERYAPRYLDQPGGAGPFDYYSEEFYQTQYKLLESRALVKKAVDKFNLKEYPAYAPIYKRMSEGDEARKQRAEETIVNMIAGGVSIEPIRQSSLVNLNYSSTDPKLAAFLANSLAQSYIEQSLDLRFAASQEAATWLKQKVIEARTRLEESETKLNQYKRAQNIVTVEDKESITAQKLEVLNKELVAAQTRRMETQTRFNEVTHGRPIAQVLNNTLIQTLKAQEAKLVAEQSELGKKYGVEHPRLIQLNHELSATRGKIAGETAQIVQTIKNEYNMAKEQEENLKKALNASKTDTQDLGDRVIQYHVLLREVETNRALYDNILKTLKTITATQNIPSTNIRIVYSATVPEWPISPRKSHNLMVASLLGLIFGVGLAFGLEGLDTTLKTAEDVQGWLEIPNLALIPLLNIAANNPASDEMQELVVHHGGDHLSSESYRTLRTSILFSTPGHSPQILLVTSSLPGEGKTLTASNLACAMAKSEPTILLVDSDLRRPCLHELFRISNDSGLSNFLVGEIDELPCVKTTVPNLFVVPAGPIPPNPSELLGSTRMQEFLNKAKEQFGRVILDSPPVISVTDAPILSTMVEGVLLVVRAETVPRKIAIEAKERLRELKAPIIGAVLNAMPIYRDGYFYNYYYHHHYYHHSEKDSKTSRYCRLRRKDGRWYRLGWIKDRFADFRDKFSS
jgi:polysaccharide biosynthesis transport protein